MAGFIVPRSEMVFCEMMCSTTCVDFPKTNNSALGNTWHCIHDVSEHYNCPTTHTYHYAINWFSDQIQQQFAEKALFPRTLKDTLTHTHMETIIPLQEHLHLQQNLSRHQHPHLQPSRPPSPLLPPSLPPSATYSSASRLLYSAT